MMKQTSFVSALAALSMMTIGSVAAASSHREAPAIADDPAADNTDLYAWVQGTDLVIVADYIGLELPEGGPNWTKFSDDVLYEIHIAHGGTSLSDALTYQLQFTTAKPTRVTPGMGNPLPVYPNTGGTEFFAQLTNSGAFAQTYTVTQLTAGGTPTVITSAPVVVPPPNVGLKTDGLVYQIKNGKTYENTFGDLNNTSKTIGSLMGGGMVFAGPRDDPFFADLGAIFDLAQLRPVFNSNELQRNSLAYMNVHAIVLEIPLTVANLGTAPTGGKGNVDQTIGIWASASRRKVRLSRRQNGDAHFGPWVQVSRVGLPLINEAVIGLQDKDFYNHTTPADDFMNFGAYFLNPIIVRDAQAAGLYAPGSSSMPTVAFACGITDMGMSLQSNRMDILNTINLGNTGITMAATGDVLRVDLGTTSGFPNGRLLTDPVVDVSLGLLLCGAAQATSLVGSCGPQGNEPEAQVPKTDNNGNPVFPYLMPPWEGHAAQPRTVPIR